MGKQANRLRGSLRSVSRGRHGGSSLGTNSPRSVSRGRISKGVTSPKTDTEDLTTTAFDSGWGGTGTTDIAVQPTETTFTTAVTPREGSTVAQPEDEPRRDFVVPPQRVSSLLPPQEGVDAFVEMPPPVPPKDPPRMSVISAAQSTPAQPDALDFYTRNEMLRQVWENSRRQQGSDDSRDLELLEMGGEGSEGLGTEGFGYGSMAHDQPTHEDIGEGIRAGHGDMGSVQSDDNFTRANELEEDAVSDTEEVRELRRGRSRDRVGRWRDRDSGGVKGGVGGEERRSPRMEETRRDFMEYITRQRERRESEKEREMNG